MTSSWDLGDEPDDPRPGRTQTKAPKQPRAAKTPATGRSPRRRGRRMPWILGAVAIVVIAGGLGAWWLATRGPDPETVAEEYLAALQAGDADALRDLTGAAAGDDALESFAQASDYVSDAELGSVEVEGDRAQVHATVTLAGESRDVTVPMERSDGEWILPSHTTVTVTSTMGTVAAIGERTFAENSPQPLLPAVYEVVPQPSEILTGAATVAVFPGEERAEVTLEASLADGAREVVQQRLDEHVASCAEATDAVPEACGIVVPWASDLRELRETAFTVERTPLVELDADAGTFAATGGALVARMTGVAHDGSEQTFTYRTDEWSLRGTMEFRDAQLVLSVF